MRLMHYAGGNDHFSGPNPNEFVLGSSSGLDTPVFNAAIERLLDLELIFSDFDPRQLLHSCYLTYFGKELLNDLGIRKPAEPTRDDPSAKP